MCGRCQMYMDVPESGAFTNVKMSNVWNKKFKTFQILNSWNTKAHKTQTCLETLSFSKHKNVGHFWFRKHNAFAIHRSLRSWSTNTCCKFHILRFMKAQACWHFQKFGFLKRTNLAKSQSVHERFLQPIGHGMSACQSNTTKMFFGLI